MKHSISITAVFSAVIIACAQQDTQPPDGKGAPAKSADKTAASSPGKPGIIMTDSITTKATVVDVDANKRTVTLKNEEGKTETVKVGAEVRNFDQIKKGDEVKTTYYQSAVVEVRMPNEPPARRESKTLISAPEGQKPGGVLVDTTEVRAIVEDVDYDKRTVTLKGPDGKIRTLKVSPEVKRLSSVKKGDELFLQLTEALAIDVSKP